MHHSCRTALRLRRYPKAHNCPSLSQDERVLRKVLEMSDVDEGLEMDHSLSHSASPTSTLSSKSSSRSQDSHYSQVKLWCDEQVSPRRPRPEPLERGSWGPGAVRGSRGPGTRVYA